MDPQREVRQEAEGGGQEQGEEQPHEGRRKSRQIGINFLQTFSTGGKYLQYWKYKQKVGSTVYRTCGHETRNNFLVELYSISGQ